MKRTHRYLIFAAAVCTAAACRLDALNWPAAVHCGDRPAEVLELVVGALQNARNVEKAIANIAKHHGADVVVCALEHIRSNAPAVSLGGPRQSLQTRAADLLDNHDIQIVP